MSGIAFRDITVRYPTRPVAALDGVSFDARPGLLTSVVGPNGGGKSTLVRALLRRIPLESGSVDVSGAPIAAMNARDFARLVAVVPQREEPVLPLPVREFVTLGRHPHRGAFAALSAADISAVDEAIHLAGVEDTLSRSTDQLSGGEWQRVRIARALAQQTSILVLDEPTAFLDVAHEMAVFELLDSLARDGRAVLLISHQLNLVARFASHIVLLNEGRVAARGTSEDVMQGSILERVYNWPLVITRDPAVGAPSLLPLRKQSTTRP
ncbi:MAG: ABC transporter ATP-binding protein [Phycisphaerae bacterium]|nr:ABC transporter ATP-binding protein [Gemmatimonadaceae bacterium]